MSGEATVPPKAISLLQDAVYFVAGQTPGVEITRQFYANQVISDADIISEMINRGILYKEV